MTDTNTSPHPMTDITVVDFLGKYKACIEGRQWALSTGCQTMRELWAHGGWDERHRVWVFTQDGVCDSKTLRLYAVWCAREVQSMVADISPNCVLGLAEAYIKGHATFDELNEANKAHEVLSHAISCACDRDAAMYAAAQSAGALAKAAAYFKSIQVGYPKAWDGAWTLPATRIMEIMPEWPA